MSDSTFQYISQSYSNSKSISFPPATTCSKFRVFSCLIRNSPLTQMLIYSVDLQEHTWPVFILYKPGSVVYTLTAFQVTRVQLPALAPEQSRGNKRKGVVGCSTPTRTGDGKGAAYWGELMQKEETPFVVPTAQTLPVMDKEWVNWQGGQNVCATGEEAKHRLISWFYKNNYFQGLVH